MVTSLCSLLLYLLKLLIKILLDCVSLIGQSGLDIMQMATQESESDVNNVLNLPFLHFLNPILLDLHISIYMLCLIKV